MAMKRIDPRRIKRNRSYSVEEVSALLGVHKNTVRGWRRAGLETIDGKRPALFHGATLHAWLTSRRTARKSPCPAGTLYCFRCRAPRPPTMGLINYVPISATGGNIKAPCATCETVMHRRVALRQLTAIMPGFDVQIAPAQSRLMERPLPSVNCDLAAKGSAR